MRPEVEHGVRRADGPAIAERRGAGRQAGFYLERRLRLEVAARHGRCRQRPDGRLGQQSRTLVRGRQHQRIEAIEALHPVGDAGAGGEVFGSRGGARLREPGAEQQP